MSDFRFRRGMTFSDDMSHQPMAVQYYFSVDFSRLSALAAESIILRDEISAIHHYFSLMDHEMPAYRAISPQYGEMAARFLDMLHHQKRIAHISPFLSRRKIAFSRILIVKQADRRRSISRHRI